jgi:LysM domain
MSVRRLVLTGAVMAAVALLLGSLATDPHQAVAALADPQGTVDREGADVLLLAATGLAAWGVWGWGALGLALTAASVTPGVVGAAARSLLPVLLPAGARRGAALALGIGLGVAAPVLLAALPGDVGPALATAGASAAVTDWPAADADVPDWPAEQPDGDHVVVRGDCLWTIAAARLSVDGAPPPDAAVAGAVQAWWSANAGLIGPDSDLIFPGQVLQPPDQP